MERFKFDAVSRTLVMSADFARAVAVADEESAEYKLYLRMRKEIPDLKVERRTHASPTSYKGKNGKKTSYYPTKGLSYERMEKFMGALPEGQKYLDEYKALKAVSGICPSPYAVVRQWFEKQFPLYRNNPLFYVKNCVEVIDYARECTRIAIEYAFNEWLGWRVMETTGFDINEGVRDLDEIEEWEFF